MPMQKMGALAAFAEALIYVAGFVWFFAVLNPGDQTSPEQRLAHLIAQRDFYYAGYLVTGVVFSFLLIALVQALYQRLSPMAPQLMRYASVVGYLWAGIVLASSFIFLTSLGALAKYHETDAAQALTIYRAIAIQVEALGGGIELVGAVWLLLISYVGLRHRIFHPLMHGWGLLVGLSGLLTLFGGLSLLATWSVFEVMAAIFGVGQILWFAALGLALWKDAGAPMAANPFSTPAVQ